MGLHLTGSSLTGLSNAFAALPKVVTTVSASGAAVVNKHNPADASGATRAISLPTGQPEGTEVSVEKVDSSTNPVNVTGNIRGVGSSTLGLAWQFESVMFRADSAGSWWPVAGHKTKTAIDAAIATAAGGKLSARTAYLGPVSNRGRLPTSTQASTTYREMMTWRLYRATDKIPAAALVFSSVCGTSENSVTAAGTVEASIEYPVGTITRVTFGGGNQGSMAASTNLQSDTVTLPTAIPRGARFWVGTYVSWGVGNVPRMQDGLYNTDLTQMTAARESHIAGTTVGSVTNTVMSGARGSNAVFSSGTSDSYGPTAVLGMTQRPTVFLAGDSEGTASLPALMAAQDTWGVHGITEQVVGYDVGYINACIPLDTYALANASYTQRLALSAFCSHVLDQYGVNSVYSTAVATSKTQFGTFRAKFPTTKPFFKTTVVPKIGSGSWYKQDMSDQTPAATLSNFTGFNDWVRQGMDGQCDGFIDLELATALPGTGKFAGAERVVADAAMTSGSSVLTSATAAFTVADVGKMVQVVGAGAAGAVLIGCVKTVTNATTVTLSGTDFFSNANAGTTVSGAAAGIGLSSYDGIHPTKIREQAIRTNQTIRTQFASILNAWQ